MDLYACWTPDYRQLRRVGVRGFHPHRSRRILACRPGDRLANSGLALDSDQRTARRLGATALSEWPCPLSAMALSRLVRDGIRRAGVDPQCLDARTAVEHP